MPPVLDLFGAQTGNCFRAAIALEEAGLAYTPRLVDLASGAHRGPAHLALNPRGRVPVLVVRNGADQNGADELVLTQSNAIALWADAQAPGALLPRDPVARAIAIDRWLFVVTDIIILNGAAFRLQRAGLPKEARAPLEAEATGALAELEDLLGDRPWLGGETFTLADIAGYTIARHYQAALDWARLPRLRRWFEAAGARPAVQRGLAAFG
jgi:GSH-dependent disulfide-bond oxidoreductase